LAQDFGSRLHHLFQYNQSVVLTSGIFAMSQEGTVKSFNGAKGYGFITKDDGSDVFVHERDCGGAAPQAGDRVTFEAQESPSKPGTYVAKDVTGCTGIPEGKGGEKGGKNGGKGGGKGTGKYEGAVKSFVESKGYGFINHQEGGDVFFHQKDMVDGSVPDRGDVVRYDVEDNPGKPGTIKATNVTGGSKGKGQGKSKEFGGCQGMDYGKGGYGGKDAYGKGGYGAAPAWAADPWAPAWGADPYGKGGGGWGGDAWGCGGKGGGDPWGKGGGDAWGKGKSCKGGW